jgi:UDP-2,4-diacetamido-2,4,6-trideoxy-beta-L-altropyranose hydrolase
VSPRVLKSDIFGLKEHILQNLSATLGTLLIRADANSVIGTGHVMRCLALAQAWQDAGGAVAFACTDLPDSLRARLDDDRCTVHLIDAHPGTESDLEQTRRLAEAIAPKWLVLDGYDFGSVFQLALRDEKWRLLSIDDDGRHGEYHAEVLLNQNAGALAVLYGRHMHATRLLLGCQYVLLRREFLQMSRKTASVAFPSRVLLSLGGADLGNLTEQFLKISRNCTLAACDIDVLVGPANPHLDRLRQLAGEMKRVVLYEAPDNVPEIMSACDMAITAAGSSVYELGYLGVPMLLVVTAENQQPIAAALDRLEAARSLDKFGTCSTADLEFAIDTFLHNAVLRDKCMARALELVDGQGAARVVAILRHLGDK